MPKPIKKVRFIGRGHHRATHGRFSGAYALSKSILGAPSFDDALADIWELCSVCLRAYDAVIPGIDVDEADVLCHVHISENDRSTPGQGNVRWCENFDALRQINYQGWLMVEAFGLALPELAAATKIWRRMFESEEQLCRDSLAFMRAEVAKRW